MENINIHDIMATQRTENTAAEKYSVTEAPGASTLKQLGNKSLPSTQRQLQKREQLDHLSKMLMKNSHRAAESKFDRLVLDSNR